MKLFLVLLLLITIATPGVVHAETGSDTATTPIVTEIEASPTLSAKKELEKAREAAKNQYKTTKSMLKEEFKIEKKNFKEEIKTKRKEMQASISAERSEFKQKLQLIKDQRKKITAQNIDTKLADINKNRTDKMADALERMTGFITKLQDKITIAKTSGQNTSSAESAVASAQTAISSAQTAVTTQAGKTYAATITDESSLGEAFSAQMTTMMNDLKTTYASITAAREALIKAIKEVARLRITNDVSSNSAE